MKLFYSSDYVAAAHEFDTTRKAAWIADSLRHRSVHGVEVVAPEPVTVEQLELAHTPEYVEAVRTGTPDVLASSSGFSWCSNTWRAVTTSTGGVLAAARAALTDGVSGSLSSGLHHARTSYGEGFCTFNGLAVAAKALLDEGAVSSVLIVDVDAHCGGGTASIIADDDRIFQVDVSTSDYDGYRPQSNAHLWEEDVADCYVATLSRALVLAPSADLTLYNAGMDPYERCPIGGLPGIDMPMLHERERSVFAWARRRSLPIAFALAGGYTGPDLTKETLVTLHRMTIQEAAVAQQILRAPAPAGKTAK